MSRVLGPWSTIWSEYTAAPGIFVQKDGGEGHTKSPKLPKIHSFSASKAGTLNRSRKRYF